MGFLDIFKSKSQSFDPMDLGLFQVDMHSHLIPGIDDGAQTMDDAIVMLAKFEDLGYRKVITTPHIMADSYKNTPEIILSGLEAVRSTAKEVGLQIEIEAAAEYYYDESLLNKLKNKERLMTFGENYVLFEFSFQAKPSRVEDLLFELLSQNYKPVLAHYERYGFLLGNVDQAKEWRERGVNIQMNLNSLTGHYGPEVKKQAENLVDRKLVDFVGSDCHRIDHLMKMEQARSTAYMHKLLELDLKNKEL